ncbi:MAG: accessory factor UbiK family protein [Pseudomonadota bacterium]
MKRAFEDMTRVAGGTAALVSMVRREVETIVKARMGRLLSEMDLVSREDYDLLRSQLQNLQNAHEQLRAEFDQLQQASSDHALPADDRNEQNQ